MREADRYTIEDYGVPSFALMEVAGRGCTEHILKKYGPLEGERIVILCGKGNNGGDGLVVGRHLYSAGADVHVVLTSPAGDLSGDAARNLSLLRLLRDASSGDGQLTIETLQDVDALSESIGSHAVTLYVDALLGTGLTSEVREPVRSVVEWLNAQDVSVVAVDVPTGLHSDTGEVLGVAVDAERTVTMAAAKVGLLMGDGPGRAGTVEVVDIGIPPFVLERAVQRPGCVRQTTDAAVDAWWPARARDAYKYSAGTVLVVGGAPRYTGAPVMASKAAARSGAGYVQCACPETVQSTLAGALTTVPTRPLPVGEGGGIVSDGALEVLSDALETADALLVGPGLGRAAETQEFVRRLVTSVTTPMVVDADGLNALAGQMDELAQEFEPACVLTPHAGEFRRLAESDVDLTDRVAIAHAYANRWDLVCLLKGTPSIVAGPDGRSFLSSRSTPALATAGTGDVLAGQCVGLLAQGVPPVEAAAAALHLGGAAAERYSATHDPRTMVATDLLDMLPRVASERLGGGGSPSW